MRNHWTIPAFEDLTFDAVFFARANAMRRFLLNRKTAKAGWVLNVRATTALDNMLSQIFQLKGRPTGKDINPLGPVGQKSTCVGARWMRWEADTVYKDYWSGKPKKRRDVMHLGTLFDCNITYELNAKTASFVEELKTKDRFTQHCIIRNAPWTFEEYCEWVEDIERNRRWDDALIEMKKNTTNETIQI